MANDIPPEQSIVECKTKSDGSFYSFGLTRQCDMNKHVGKQVKQEPLSSKGHRCGENQGCSNMIESHLPLITHRQPLKTQTEHYRNLHGSTTLKSNTYI